MVPKELRGHLKQLHSSTALTVVLEGAHLGQDSVTSYLVKPKSASHCLSGWTACKPALSHIVIIDVSVTIANH